MLIASRIAALAVAAWAPVAAEAETAPPARKDPPLQFNAVPDVQFDGTPARPAKSHAASPAFPKTLPPLPQAPHAKGEWTITPSVKTGPPPGSPSGPGYGPRLMPPK